MDRREALRKFAAFVGVVSVVPLEVHKGWLEITSKIRTRREGARMSEEPIEEEVKIHIPDSLDPAQWAEVGLSEEDMHRFLAQSYVMRVNMAARQAMKYNGARGKAVQLAADSYIPRSYPIRDRI